jgi:hypothetical protein
MPLVQEAEKLVEPAALRVKRRRAAEVPFAHTALVCGRRH